MAAPYRDGWDRRCIRPVRQHEGNIAGLHDFLPQRIILIYHEIQSVFPARQACGRLFHTECAYLNTLSEHIKNEHGFLVDGSKTVLYGLCKTCAKEKQHS